MISGIIIVHRNVLKIWLDEFFEEALNLGEVELRVNEDCSDVGFHNIRERLTGSVVFHIIMAVFDLLSVVLWYSSNNPSALSRLSRHPAALGYSFELELLPQHFHNASVCEIPA